MKKYLFFLPMILFLLFLPARAADTEESNHFWQVQSIDTMKQSRDLAKEKLNDKNFSSEIDTQVKNIASTGANYVAIDTPYDDQFLPYLKEWVSAARKYHVSVWFRGNFSSWEGWFDHPKQMTFTQHTQAVTQFIEKNPDLFMDGDIFSSCPECENGAQGDPRQTKKVTEYRKFLISETSETEKSFHSIGKSVHTNYWAMNKDVADLIMDKDTTKKLDGIVVVDHYVKDPNQLSDDLDQLAKKTGGKVILGEFGAPIDGITDDLNDVQKAQWVSEALSNVRSNPNVLGLNYWVNKGGKTALWNDQNISSPAVEMIKKYYSPSSLTIQIHNELNQPVSHGKVVINGLSQDFTQSSITIPVLAGDTFEVQAKDYQTYHSTLPKSLDKNQIIQVRLARQNPSWWFQFLMKLNSLWKKY